MSEGSRTDEKDVVAKLRKRSDNWQPWIDDDLEAEIGYLPDHMRYHQALDRAAADEIERLRKALQEADRRSYHAADICFGGFCYNVGSQFGIDSLKRAIARSEHG